MIVSINQPAYLPWLGYFHRIASSELHIVLDHVQFEKNSYVNRNRVRTAQGPAWLTVPVLTSGHFGELPIHRLEIDNGRDWAAKHWATLRQNYGKTEYFAAQSPFFEALYRRKWTRLADLMREANDHLTRDVLRIATPLRYSSEMGVGGVKSELVLNLCKAVGASTYLSGPLGRDYLDEARFADAGIELRYHHYTHPAYPQRYAGFEPNMSVIDLVFNCGERSREILAGGSVARDTGA